MNRKVLGIAVLLMIAFMLVSSVLAIGPQKAVKSNNPNIVFTDYSVQIFLPSGAVNEWITEEPSHVQIKSAADFYIGNCYAPSSASEMLYNKWNFLSEDVFYEFLLSVHFEPGQAYYIAYVANPGGVFYKEAFPGN